MDSPYRLAETDWSRLLTELNVDARPAPARAAHPYQRARSEPSADGPRDPWGIALARAGRLGPGLGDNRWAVLCPWNDEHTTNRDADAATATGSCALLPPMPGKLFGRPHCSHGHCQGRSLADWILAVGPVVYADALAEARGWRVAAGYVMTPFGVFEAERKPLRLGAREGDAKPANDAAPSGDAPEPPLEAAAPEDEPRGEAAAAEGPFQWAPGKRLCNFFARITKDITERSTGTERRAFRIEGLVAARPFSIHIPAEDFASLGWVAKLLGAEAVIEAGRDTKDRLRAALQHLSLPIAKQNVYGRVGWEVFDDGTEGYLDGRGAIGPAGRIAGVEVVMPDALADFELPAPLEGEALLRGVEACAELFLLSNAEVATALFGAAWVAPLGASPLTVYVSADQESGKSFLVGLAQAHFGARWHGDHLPVSLKYATPASVNKLRSLARDCLFAVDDFVLRGTLKDADLGERVDLLVRAQYSGASRLALTATGDLAKGDAAPGGVLVLNGETLAPGHSLNTRMVVVELPRPLPEEELLRAARQRAADGVYAGAMAAHLRWLAPRMTETRKARRDRAARIVEKLYDGRREHRALALLAEVGLGVGNFLEWAAEVGLAPETIARVREATWGALRSLRDRQRVVAGEQDPIKRFVALVAGAVAGKRAHVTRPDGGPPPDAHLWGWTLREALDPRRPDGDPIPQAPVPNGNCLGFVTDGHVWLDETMALAEACKLARDVGDPLPLQRRDLGRRLYEAKLLARHEMNNSQKSYLHRKRVDGKVLSGLCLSVETLRRVGTEPPVSGASDTDIPN